jgi:hypothetical protein
MKPKVNCVFGDYGYVRGLIYKDGNDGWWGVGPLGTLGLPKEFYNKNFHEVKRLIKKAIEEAGYLHERI